MLNVFHAKWQICETVISEIVVQCFEMAFDFFSGQFDSQNDKKIRDDHLFF